MGGEIMSININVNKQTSSEIEKCAALYGISVEEFVRRAVMDRLEDEYDLQCAKEALKEYEEDPVVYTLEEVEQHLGIED